MYFISKIGIIREYGGVFFWVGSSKYRQVELKFCSLQQLLIVGQNNLYLILDLLREKSISFYWVVKIQSYSYYISFYSNYY